MKASSMSRAIEMAKLVTQIGIKELRSGDVKSRYEQAFLITKSLSQLKGAAMKAGQLLSLDLDNYFPPEAIEILSQLQSAAVAHPFSEIERVISSQIPLEKRKLVHSIDKVPLGVASIGQVHRARYQEIDIVLKVQYADVAESVDSDLKILKTLAQTFCQLTGRKMNLEPLFLEFKDILEQELDYTREAQFQNEYFEKVQRLKGKSECTFSVPKSFSEISSKKVLAMTFQPGLTLRSWLNQNPSELDKKNVAVAILDLYFHEFFEWGLVQTDPNWGNFLIHQKPSEINICLLDFGACRLYKRDFIQNYIRLLDLASKNKSKELRTLSIEFGLIDARESEMAFKSFENMLKTAIKPFFSHSSMASQDFDFSDVRHSIESQAAAKALSQELVYSPPPYSIVFLHRKLAGVYSILKNLKVRLDVSPYWQMMKDLSEGKS